MSQMLLKSVSRTTWYGLPHGSAVEAVRGSALLKAAAQATDPADREHVTPLIRRGAGFFALAAIGPGHLRRPGLRLTVDTEDDLAFMQKLLAAVGPRPFPAPLATILDVTDRMPAAASAAPGRREVR